MSKDIYSKLAKDAEAIVQDLSRSWDMHHFYEGLEDVVNGNLNHINGIEGGPHFVLTIRMLYAHSVSLGVRRQVKASKESISLVGLLEEIKSKQMASQFISFTEYEKWWGSNGWDLAKCAPFYGWLRNGHSDILYAVQADLERLRQGTRPIESFVDKMIAHSDRRPPELPAFSDVDAALEVLSDVALKWHKALTGTELFSIKGTYTFHAAAPLKFALDIRP